MGIEADLPSFLMPPKAQPTKDRGAQKLLANTIDRFFGLILTHSPDAPGAVSSVPKFIFLQAEDNAAETLQVIYTGYQLLEAKRSLYTLAAFRDRKEVKELDFEPLSEFMTYLRFHLGDALFASYLIRVGARLQAIVDSKVFKHGSPFAEAISKITRINRKNLGELSRACAALRKDWNAEGKKINSTRVPPMVWDKQTQKLIPGSRVDMKETVWRHIGILDELRKAPKAPAWLPPKSPKPSAELKNGATSVLNLLIALDKYKGLPAIEAFLSKSKFTTLAKLASKDKDLFPNPNIASALAPISKSHSFTRLQGTIAEDIPGGRGG